jgi:hypothetical protein
MPSCVTGGRASDCTATAMSTRNGPGFELDPIDNYVVWQVGPCLSRRSVIIAGGCLHTSKLDSEGRLRLIRHFLLCKIERQSPIVDVGVVRILAKVIGLATKHAPVYIVQISKRRRANIVLDAVGEIFHKVMNRPVEAVLARLIGVSGVLLVAVAKLPTAFVWCPDTPEFDTSRLCIPSGSHSSNRSSLHHDAVLFVLAKNAIGVYGQAVCASPYRLNCDATGTVNVTPVLIRLTVLIVVLEVRAV